MTFEFSGYILDIKQKRLNRFTGSAFFYEGIDLYLFLNNLFSYSAVGSSDTHDVNTGCQLLS